MPVSARASLGSVCGRLASEGLSRVLWRPCAGAGLAKAAASSSSAPSRPPPGAVKSLLEASYTVYDSLKHGTRATTISESDKERMKVPMPPC